MVQHSCGDKERNNVTPGKSKLVRGLENRRSIGARALQIMEKDGQVIESVEVGYPPREKKIRFITPTESAHKTLVHHKDVKNNDEDCKE